MAEAILREKSDHQVKSAGISTTAGIPTSENTVNALKTKNINYSGISQPLTHELVEWADLILTMTNQHKHAAVSEYPQAFGKAYTLKEYVSDDVDQIWRALKQAHLNLEEKRSLVIEEHGNQQTEQQLRAFFREEQDEIARLEQELPSLDIADPFGLDQAAYQETAAEINQAIDALIKKLSK